MGRFRPFRVRLPSGDRYWTVVDAAYRPVAEADEWLLHVRLGRDCAESTTEAYARSLSLFLDWCAAIGLADKAVLDALFDLTEDYDLPAEVRGDRAGLQLRSRPR